MMTRLPDWRLQLDALVSARMHAPFAWGVNDCALFAADAVAAVTGQDPASHLRGHRTARQALRTIRSHAGLFGIATSALGAPAGEHNAREGDVLLVGMGKRTALGVMLNDGMLVGPGTGGLCSAPLTDALCAWRVG
jgi:hypothetical protein